MALLKRLNAFGGSRGHGIDASARVDAKLLLTPGDVIATRTNRSLVNYLIPGWWSHVAMYVGDGDVVDAISSGVTRRSLDDLLDRIDHVKVLRPTFASPKRRRIASTVMCSYLGTPYDYGFLPGDGALYCSEAVWKSYKESCGDSFSMELRERVGVPTVTPQDIVDSAYFEEIL